MTPPRRLRSPATGVALGLAFVMTSPLVAPVAAQPMSSGSGAGTGTGLSGGAARNSTGTGMESGSLGGSTGTGTESGGGPNRLPSRRLMLPGPNDAGTGRRGVGGGRGATPRAPGGESVPMGPGIDTTFPGDPASVPLGSTLNAGNAGNAAAYSTVGEQNLRYARGIASPGDRSLTLSRIASAATFTNQLNLAEKALGEASTAALRIPPGLVRDQRLISIITAITNLAEARLREGRGDSTASESADAPAPALPKEDRSQLIHRALTDWLRAADLARRIGNPTYRSEVMYRVCDALAFGSQSIINEFPRPENGADQNPGGGLDPSFEGLPDRMLADAARLASRIERPVWRDRALVTVATAAAESKQFTRALRTARMIPQPEVRTDALLKLAEIQARRNDPRGATTSYREAAEAIASIPLEDPRAVLSGVLIDNLIAVGRFEDARASIGLYPDESRRLSALGAIAESQSRRGASAAAIAWINREVPAAHRSPLYRRVSNGVVAAIEQNRSRDLSNPAER